LSKDLLTGSTLQRRASPPQGRRTGRIRRSSHAEPAEDTEKNKGYFRQDDPSEIVLRQFHGAGRRNGMGWEKSELTLMSLNAKFPPIV